MKKLRSTIVFGAQWGDEGKGKIVDHLAKFYDGVARYQGGHNAGHTLIIGDKKIVLHLVPCGIVNANTKVHLGSNVVISPSALMAEIQELQDLGISVKGRLTISPRASIIFPYHEVLDKAREASLGATKKIGTTGRGIGPAYEDLAARRGMTIEEFLDPRSLEERLINVYEEKKWLCSTVYQATLPSWPEIHRFCDRYRKFLEPLVGETRQFLDELPSNRLLLEGAQGALLDLHQGTYPYVTSSLTGVAGAISSLAIPPQSIEHIVGVTKAYCTRVGSGSFPSELHGEIGNKLREAGGEYGATTGRPRRCGWIDLPLLRSVIKSQGVTALIMTKLDVLVNFPTVGVVVSYGGEKDIDPRDKLLRKVQPVVRDMKPISAVDSLEAKDYISFLEDELETPIIAVGVGAERENILIRHKIPGLTVPMTSGK